MRAKSEMNTAGSFITSVRSSIAPYLLQPFYNVDTFEGIEISIFMKCFSKRVAFIFMNRQYNIAQNPQMVSC